MDDKKKQLLDRRKNYDPRRRAQGEATSRERNDNLRIKSNVRQSDKSPVQREPIQFDENKPVQGSSVLKLGNVVNELRQKNIGSPLIVKIEGSILGQKNNVIDDYAKSPSH